MGREFLVREWEQCGAYRTCPCTLCELTNMDLGKVLLVTNVVRRADEYYACGVQMTQAQYDRVREARAQGVQLNTHAQIEAFLGMKPAAPTVMRVSPSTPREAEIARRAADNMAPAPVKDFSGVTPAPHGLVHPTRAQGVGVGAPIPKHAPGGPHCWSCDTVLEARAVRCPQCGALVGT